MVNAQADAQWSTWFAPGCIHEAACTPSGPDQREAAKKAVGIRSATGNRVHHLTSRRSAPATTFNHSQCWNRPGRDMPVKPQPMGPSDRRRRGKHLFARQPRHAKQAKSTCSIQVGRLELRPSRCKRGTRLWGTSNSAKPGMEVRPAYLMVKHLSALSWSSEPKKPELVARPPSTIPAQQRVAPITRRIHRHPWRSMPVASTPVGRLG